MSSRGERHDSMCCDYFDLIFLFALIFYYPIFSHYPMSDLGGERHLREENISNSLHIFILGDMSIPD